MTWVQWITIGTAVTGAVLGVVNLVWSWYRDRVRIEVAPMWLTRTHRVGGKGATMSIVSHFAEAVDREPEGRIGIRVTNFGFLEVTIDSVGLTNSNWWARRSNRRRRLKPLTSDYLENVTLPHRLKPRETIVLWCGQQGDELDSRLKGVTRVYANTACGLDVFGTSGLLRRLVRRANRSS